MRVDGKQNSPHVSETAPPVHHSLGEESFADVVSATQVVFTPVKRHPEHIGQLLAVNRALALLLQA